MTMIWILLQFLVEKCKLQIFKGVWNDGSASGNHVTPVSGLRSLALVSWRSLKTGNSHPDASEAADDPRSKNIIIIFVHGSLSPLDWRVEWHYSRWRPNGISGKNRLSGTWPKAGLPDLNPRTCLCAIWMVIYFCGIINARFEHPSHLAKLQYFTKLDFKGLNHHLRWGTEERKSWCDPNTWHVLFYQIGFLGFACHLICWESVQGRLVD